MDPYRTNVILKEAQPCWNDPPIQLKHIIGLGIRMYKLAHLHPDSLVATSLTT
jgi:hypothetical protein